jgi:predicted permease
VAPGDFSRNFRPEQIAAVLAATLAAAALGFLLSALLHLPAPTAMTFTQTCYHGNTGYIALAVLLYVLGQEGLARASVLVGFTMLFNNTISLGLFTFSPRRQERLSWAKLRSFLGNPIVAATLLGLGYSALRLPLPAVVGRSIGIVSDMALPVALLIIGGSLSARVRARLPLAHLAALLKLAALPALGILFLRLLDAEPAAALPAVIVLGSPTATISYVMAKEMDGDPELATAAVTVSTVLSIVTYTLWIAFVRGQI